jgi:hypothetical protein
MKLKDKLSSSHLPMSLRCPYYPRRTRWKRKSFLQVPLELKIKYLNRRILDLEGLKTSLNNGDYSLALKLGHQVKGNALTFDFPQMAPLGIEIEKAAHRMDRDMVMLLANKMETAIRLAQSSFKENCP